jgi:DNA-binding NarL/FixJ family response regulator
LQPVVEGVLELGARRAGGWGVDERHRTGKPGTRVQCGAHVRRHDQGEEQPSVTVRLLAHFSAAIPPAQPVQPALPLTDREEEVLRAAARGRSNAEIAEELYISLGTVKTHLSSLQEKVGARNRVELAAFAWQSRRMRD